MNRLRVFLPAALFALIAIVLVPLHVLAAGGFFDPIVPEACRACPCGLGGVLQLIQNFMNVCVSIGILAMMLAITYGGVMLLLTPTNPEAKSQAKNVLLNAVVGFVIVLSAWLVVDFIMKLIYNPAAVVNGSETLGPWNKILNLENGSPCIQTTTPRQIAGLPSVVGAIVDGVSGGTTPAPTPTPGPTTTTPPGALSNSGRGACNATTVKNAALSGGARMTTQEANIIACVAGPESQCGAALQNYNWDAARHPPPSTAYGPFQITLKSHPQCFNNATCRQAAGVSGTLNCHDAFNSGGYSIPGPLLESCKRAAANFTCSAVAAHCVYAAEGPHAWTADPHHAEQQACITANGG